MKWRIHFGPGSFTHDDDDDNDAHLLRYRMVQLVQLAFPNLFSNPVLPSDNTGLLSVLVQADPRYSSSPPRNHSLNVSPPPTPQEKDITIDMEDRFGQNELRFQLVLEVHLRSLGKLLIFTWKQWEVIKALLLQKLSLTSTNTERNIIPPSTDVSVEDDRGNECIDLDVVLLHHAPHDACLRVFRYEEFIKSFLGFHQERSTAIERIAVTDVNGNRLGEVRIDMGQPPLRHGLEETLRAPLSLQQPIRIAYRVGNHKELLPLDSDADISRMICDVRQFGGAGITIVMTVPGASTPLSVPLLTAGSNSDNHSNSSNITTTTNNDNNAAVAEVHPTAPLESPLRVESSSLLDAETSSPASLLVVADEARALQQKREETRRIVSKYVQLMRSLRCKTTGVPQRWVSAVPRSVGTVTNSQQVSSTPETGSCAGEDFLIVRYELDPLEVCVVGNITEEELQCLANAILDRCVYPGKKNHCNHNNTTNTSPHNVSNGENHSKYTDMVSSSPSPIISSSTGDTSERGLYFRRLPGSMYILPLHECGALTAAQITQLETCLVDVVTQFGCRWLRDGDAVELPQLHRMRHTLTNPS